MATSLSPAGREPPSGPAISNIGYVSHPQVERSANIGMTEYGSVHRKSRDKTDLG